ncbi:hypothetical protein C8Q80DRAFT_1123671 [Daedaleopsis nitida]|nr:hypothetical protein C8Q80DRAFT_1123671 [Daedaleopsis nitida]
MASNDTAPTTTTTTLYPKIYGDIRSFLRGLARHGASPSSAAPLYMTGTVKLHGTHADMRVDLSLGRDHATVTAQSRNNAVLTRAQDNFGFAAFCSAQRAAIVRLAERVCARWRELHPDEDNAPADEVILAGEWIGRGIQKKPHTAIRDLSPRLFVLCGVRIRGVWEHIERYADIADEGAQLYNISRGGFFRLPFTLGEVDDDGDGNGAARAAAAFLAEARRLTAEVHARCPFGAALGVEGPGEGIVWNPSPDQGVLNEPDLWLKTKGEDFEGRPKKDSNENVVAKDEDKKAAVEAFVCRACHERRLEQGWDYLREMHVERNTNGIPKLEEPSCSDGENLVSAPA